MFSLTLVGLLFPLIVVVAGVILLLVLLNTLGIVLGLLWPALPILIGLALIWRVLRGCRR